MIERCSISEVLNAGDGGSSIEIMFYEQFQPSKIKSYHELVMMLPEEPLDPSAEVEDVEVLNNLAEYDPRIWGWTWRVQTKDFKGGWLRQVKMKCRFAESWDPDKLVVKRRWMLPPDPIEKMEYSIAVPEGYTIQNVDAHFLTDIERVSPTSVVLRKDYLEMGFKRFEFKLTLSK